jgi:acetoin utilization deacetylase AcuC-like enzyme
VLMPKQRKTGWVTHEYYFWHDTGTYAGSHKPGEFLQPGKHYESPESKRRFKGLMDVSSLRDELIHIEPRRATVAELERIHNPKHIQNMKTLSDNEGGLTGDDESVFGPFGYEIGCLAAGGAIVAADAVYKGEVDVAYALIRPPGHHAVKDHGMGFCMFNNIGVAIEHLKKTTDLRKFAVIDWDVHHGNGTQAVFYNDPSVLTISLHQDELYPRHEGKITETGEGAGLGFNINIPMPAGSGDGAYRYAFESVVKPAIDRFQPEFIFIASGFDASYYDPLSRMAVHAYTYNWMANQVLEMADKYAQGRVVTTHEGGYSEVYVPFCGLAVLEAFLGKSSGIIDIMATGSEAATRKDQTLLPHQKEMIDECKKTHKL